VCGAHPASYPMDTSG